MRHRLPPTCKDQVGFNPRICKRCDYPVTRCAKWKICFNPRICKRCDRLWIWKQLSRLSFNPRICKRCDLDSQRPNISMTCFNPRICKRCDKKSGGEVNVDYVSIHASVKDATIILSFYVHKFHSFNPRICKRCDFFTIFVQLVVLVFQSTHL